MLISCSAWKTVRWMQRNVRDVRLGVDSGNVLKMLQSDSAIQVLKIHLRTVYNSDASIGYSVSRLKKPIRRTWSAKAKKSNTTFFKVKDQFWNQFEFFHQFETPYNRYFQWVNKNTNERYTLNGTMGLTDPCRMLSFIGLFLSGRVTPQYSEGFNAADLLADNKCNNLLAPINGDISCFVSDFDT